MLLAGFVLLLDAHGHRHLQRPDAHPMDRKTGALALAAVLARHWSSRPAAQAERSDRHRHVLHPWLRSRHRRARRRRPVARVLGRQRRAVGARPGSASPRRRRSSTSATGRRRWRCSAPASRPTPSSRRSSTAIPIRAMPASRGRRPGRQFAVMNPKGEYAAYTGPQADDMGREQGRQVLHRAGQHPRRRGGRQQHGEELRGDEGAAVAASRRRARRGTGRRRRHARPAVGGAASSSRRTAASGCTTTPCCACRSTTIPSRSRSCAAWSRSRSNRHARDGRAPAARE